MASKSTMESAPLYGAALAQRRMQCGFVSARELAMQSKDLMEHLDASQFQAFSQQSVSRLEGDKVGDRIAHARPGIQRMLSCLLGWTAQEFAAHVGVAIPHVPWILKNGGLEPVVVLEQTRRFTVSDYYPPTQAKAEQAFASKIEEEGIDGDISNLELEKVAANCIDVTAVVGRVPVVVTVFFDDSYYEQPSPLQPNLATMIADKKKRHPSLQTVAWQQFLNNLPFADAREPDDEAWFEIYITLQRHNVQPTGWPGETN